MKDLYGQYSESIAERQEGEPADGGGGRRVAANVPNALSRNV